MDISNDQETAFVNKSCRSIRPQSNFARNWASLNVQPT